MNPATPRLTIDALAPTVGGIRRPAPQPLGTWHSRWACLYLDPTLVPTTTRVGVTPAKPLPSLSSAA